MALWSNSSCIRSGGSGFESCRHQLLFWKRSVQTGDEMPGMKTGPESALSSSERRKHIGLEEEGGRDGNRTQANLLQVAPSNNIK